MRPVRVATIEDLPGIVRRWREMMAVHAEVDPVLYALAPHAPQTYGSYIRRRLEDQDSRVLVASPSAGSPGDSDLAGYLVAGIGERANFFEVRDVGMIFDLAVRPDQRGHGLGRLLVEAAEAWFRHRRMTYAQCEWTPANPLAAGFWPRVGYRVLLAEAYRKL